MLYKIEFKPQSLKEGKKISKKEQEALDDYEDFKDLRQAKKAEKNAPTVSLEEAKKELGL